MQKLTNTSLPTQITSCPPATCAMVAGQHLSAALWMIVGGLVLAIWGLLNSFLLWLFEVFSWAPLPIGCMAVAWGVWQLSGLNLSGGWRRKSGISLVLAVAVLGLTPFLLWWRWLPSNMYFTINLLVLAICFALLLASVNWMVAELGKLGHDATMAVEAYFVGILVLVGWLVPLAVFVVRLAIFSTDAGEPFGWVIRSAVYSLSRAQRLVFIVSSLLPVGLTCAGLIKAHRLVERQLLADFTRAGTKSLEAKA